MVSRMHFPLDEDALAAFCRKNGIRKLSLFGSVLTDRFSPESDLDVLVVFEPDVRVGLIRKAGIQLELSGMVGRRVDLRTPAELSRHFRERVLASVETRYVHR